MKNKFFSVLAALAVIVCSPLVQIFSSAVSIGDLNDDGVVNAQDASLILSKAAELGAGIITVTEEDFAVMDVNHDQSVNAQDANLLLHYTSLKGAGAQQLNFTDYIIQRQADPVFYGTQTLVTMGTSLAESFGTEAKWGDYRPVLVTSPTELEAFYTKVLIEDGIFNRLNALAYSSSTTLEESVAEYNDTFFAEKDLLILAIADGSMSLQWIAEDIYMDGAGVLTVTGKKYYPGVEDCSVASYLVFVETSKAVEFASSIQAEFTEVSTDLLF